MAPTTFAIMGPRCSGTNYLANLIKQNFDIQQVNDFKHVHKHWFPWSTVGRQHIGPDCLVLGISRQYEAWAESLFRNPWHLDPALCVSRTVFETKPVRSYYEADISSYYDVAEQRVTRAPDPHALVEEDPDLRSLYNRKVTYLTQQAPLEFTHYRYIAYEDLLSDWASYLHQLQESYALLTTPRYPSNWIYYKCDQGRLFVPPTGPA